MTVFVTDVKYRMAVAVLRELVSCGHRVIAVHRDDKSEPIGFSLIAKFDKLILSDQNYKDELLLHLSNYENPVLFPVGGATIDLVAENTDEFLKVCTPIAATKECLEKLNDKRQARALAKEQGISVPAENGDGKGIAFPKVIKYCCGEKLSLSAAERYYIAKDKADFEVHYPKMRAKGEVFVQEYVEGEGVGVGIAMGKGGELLSFICHRRIREFPVSGGPSAACETFYDKNLLKMAYRLLKAAGFCGAGMVEFKQKKDGSYVFLEVNPRIWGSYPLARIADLSFADRLVCGGPEADIEKPEYKIPCKMRYGMSDLAATFGYLKKGKIKKAAAGIADIFKFIPDGLYKKGEKQLKYAYFRALKGKKK